MSVTTAFSCGGFENSNKPVMNYSSSEPLPWDFMYVVSADSNGPLIVNYYYGTGDATGTLQFVHTWTYDTNGFPATLTIS